jgi:cytochrome c
MMHDMMGGMMWGMGLFGLVALRAGASRRCRPHQICLLPVRFAMIQMPLACLSVALLAGAALAQGTSPMPHGPMMGRGPDPNLKRLTADVQVQAISYCGDVYRVTTADGSTREFQERNLRFKTDSGPDGPERGAPAILPAGMLGDRASVIFAAPEDISALIKTRC